MRRKEKSYKILFRVTFCRILGFRLASWYWPDDKTSLNANSNKPKGGKKEASAAKIWGIIENMLIKNANMIK